MEAASLIVRAGFLLAVVPNMPVVERAGVGGLATQADETLRGHFRWSDKTSVSLGRLETVVAPQMSSPSIESRGLHVDKYPEAVISVSKS